MADFGLIEEHPWYTAAIIGVGALLVWLFLRSRSSASSSAATYQGGYTGTDPAIAAAQLQANAQQNALQVQANAQTNQLNAQLSALQVQGATQVQLATLSAAVQSQGITASQDVTNKQTEGQVTLGLSAQQSVVQQAVVNAAVQMASINAIVAAYGGRTASPATPSTPATPVYTGPPVTTPVSTPNVIQNPVTQTNLINMPSSGTGTPNSGTPYQTPSGWWSNANVPTLSQFGLDPSGGGMHCDPFDVACVSRQTAASNSYVQSVANAQTRNNLQQGIANYQQSVDMGTITPSQLAAMQQLQAQLAAA